MTRSMLTTISSVFVALNAVVADDNFTLFAIQEDGAIAERLPYGPLSISESNSAFLSTLVGSTNHDTWRQLGIDGAGNVLYELIWEFSSVTTIAERFQDAVDVGESVVWSINPSPGVRPLQQTGVWRFSSEAGDLASKFDGSSGTSFVTDATGNGIWGAGPGVIDGTNLPVFPGSIDGWDWGFGNLNGSDFFTPFTNSGTLVIDGVLQTELPSGFKNLMFVEALPLPGDYNGDGAVDEADYLVWASEYAAGAGLSADGNADGMVNAADYSVWRDNVGAGISATSVPEASAAILGLLSVAAASRGRTRRAAS